MGRSKKQYDHYTFKQLYDQWISGEITQQFICSRLNISRATLARRISEYQNKPTEAELRKQVFEKDVPFAFNAVNVSDGLLLLTAIKPASVAAVIFDPEYRGLADKLEYGNEGERQNDRFQLPQMSDRDICLFMQEISRIMKPSAYLFLWTDKYQVCTGTSDWTHCTDLNLVDMIVWDKGQIGMGYRSRSCSEFLQIFQKPPIRAKGTWRDRSIPDIWEEKVRSTAHPHSKPIQLQKRLILATTAPSDIIVDPCAGSYSTLHAVQDLGDRFFLGCDLLPAETLHQ